MVFNYARKRGPIRRIARRYIRSRLGKRYGSSFLSLSSRARVIPGEKRRKFDAISSQNDADPSVAVAPEQSGHASIAPLSTVRFADPSSSVFDYHHFVRRLRLSDVDIPAGAAGAVNRFIYTFSFNDIPDRLELAALYGRYRFSRVVFEFTPMWSPIFPLGAIPGAALPLIFSRPFRGSEDPADTQTKALNCPDMIARKIDKFAIGMTPNALVTDDMIESGATATVYNDQMAPWIDVDKYLVTHWGAEMLTVNTQAYGAGFAVYTVIATVYIDCDEVSLQ